MNQSNMKKMNLASLLVTSAVGLAVGILLFFHADKMFGVLAVLCGIVGLVVSIPPFLDALMRNGEEGSAAPRPALPGHNQKTVILAMPCFATPCHAPPGRAFP